MYITLYYWMVLYPTLQYSTLPYDTLLYWPYHWWYTPHYQLLYSSVYYYTLMLQCGKEFLSYVQNSKLPWINWTQWVRVNFHTLHCISLYCTITLQYILLLQTMGGYCTYWTLHSDLGCDSTHNMIDTTLLWTLLCVQNKTTI